VIYTPALATTAMSEELEYDVVADSAPATPTSSAHQAVPAVEGVQHVIVSEEDPQRGLQSGVVEDDVAKSEAEDDDDDCGCAGCDDDQPDAIMQPSASTNIGDDEQSAKDEEGPPDADELGESLATNSEHASSAAKKKKKSKRGSSQSRWEELAKPRQAPAEPKPESPKNSPKPQKKEQRPSLLLRLRPTNLNESWDAFVASDYSEPPQFTYAYPEADVTALFQENSSVCFALMPIAERIMQKVDSFGGPDKYMELLSGQDKISAEEMQDTVAKYLKEQGIEDKVEIRVVESMLSAANVSSAGEGRYYVNIANGPVAKTQVQGICDHEVGTHLLRMMNDEHQVWHGRRARYKMGNPWTTEEGFATLNTYQTLPGKLLFPQALRYFAVCRGAQVGFVELFQEIRNYISDTKRCWQMCCRIKRGMVDTSQPGAFYLDQAYFKGAVEILQHLDDIDFGRLYGGQIALQDLDKTHFLLRKDCVRLPLFLNSASKLTKYLSHCRKLIRENEIEASVERVCKAMHMRTANEFFKQKPKVAASAIVSFDGPMDGSKTQGDLPSKLLNFQRLQDLSKPRLVAVSDSEQQLVKTKSLDLARMTSLAMPRGHAETEDESSGTCEVAAKTLDLSRLRDLARPRNATMQAAEEASTFPCGERVQRELNKARLLELSLPRPVKVERAESAPVRKKGSRKSRKRIKKRRASSKSEGKGDSGEAFDAVGAAEASDGGDADGESDGGDSIAENFAQDTAPPPPPPPPPPEPDPPGMSRPLDLARVNDLSFPRKACEDDEQCKCGPTAFGARKRQSKMRLLALVQERRQKGSDDVEDALHLVDEETLVDSSIDTKVASFGDQGGYPSDVSKAANLGDQGGCPSDVSKEASLEDQSGYPSDVNRAIADGSSGSTAPAGSTNPHVGSIAVAQKIDSESSGGGMVNERLVKASGGTVALGGLFGSRAVQVGVPIMPMGAGPAGSQSRSESLGAALRRTSGSAACLDLISRTSSTGRSSSKTRAPARTTKTFSRALAAVGASGGKPESFPKAVPIKVMQLELAL